MLPMRTYTSTIYDHTISLIPVEPSPYTGENLAMLQAVYSRSGDSVHDHVGRIVKSGAKKFMETYYLAYGHQSIGDCAFATVFIEKLSIPATKAIQDSSLYNGQESSTRYINFANGTRVNPLNTTHGDEILAAWLATYETVYEAVKLEKGREIDWDNYPISEYGKINNAIHAKACDVARGFLPLGVTTQLSWTTTLRQFGDRLALLDQHPLAEVRNISAAIRYLLREQYPSSFKEEDYPERQSFYGECALDLHYQTKKEFAYLDVSNEQPDVTAFGHMESFQPWFMNRLSPKLWQNRPAKTELPRALKLLGDITFEFWLDYGSFRDIQRHRNGLCRIPLVEGPLFMHPWYTQNVPHSVADEVKSRVDSIAAMLSELTGNVADLQYYYPLAQVVPVKLVYDVPQTVYVAELRSSKHVHATVRAIALKMAATLTNYFPQIPLHIDKTPLPEFNIERGTQTFKKDL